MAPQSKMTTLMKTKTGKNSNTTNYLPDDIVFFHILPRIIAVKSLLRFSCVSKLWYKTIHHDPKFIASHYNHAKSNPSLVAVYQPKSMLRFMYLNNNIQEEGPSSSSSSSVAVDLLYTFDQIFIIGSCNGLTCIRTMGSNWIEICNPSTREIITIPYPQTKAKVVSFGFGFDPLLNEYKVLMIFSKNCFIYTLGGGGGGRGEKNCCSWRWRDITKSSQLPSDLVHVSRSLLSNGDGTTFWIMKYVNEFAWFDFHNETFQVIPGPQDNFGYRLNVDSLFQLGGCPCFVYPVELKDGFVFILYRLKQKKHQHSINPISSHHHHHHHQWKRVSVCIPFKPDTSKIHILESSGQILLQWVSVVDGHFYIYNPRTGKQQQQGKASKMESILHEERHDFLLVNQIENLQSLKTLVPLQPLLAATSGEEGIKYMSSRDTMMDIESFLLSESVALAVIDD